LVKTPNEQQKLKPYKMIEMEKIKQKIENISEEYETF
jgi:hypothetical protein